MKNALLLIRESQILYDNEAYARAFSLAHLAREEIAKVTMLYAAGLRMLAGHPVDAKKLLKRLRDHKSKLIIENLNNSFICAAGGLPEPENIALNSSNIANARNNDKNNSLYVGFDDGECTEPDQLFTAEKSLRTVLLAVDAFTNQEALLNIQGPLAGRAPISMPEIDPSKIEITKEYVQKAGMLYKLALEASKKRIPDDEDSKV